ncbi:hypothetical protein KIH39_16770 [Telmatocola sphagniphila]|uniref:Outer membrane protein beta-barrel domain-containing protein n=1 Tax=Telmatocola sphagniphila TaxID=1123043 RepID=A0A8E6ETW9_9BACT|nr:Lpg1974 family pore-forming outer membrane protein [Telmatocola sphagniphila]QVL30502.1 hypothetical protein KIH39_16770 [Telmatocola sphagniphila]
MRLTALAGLLVASTALQAQSSSTPPSVGETRVVGIHTVDGLQAAPLKDLTPPSWPAVPTLPDAQKDLIPPPETKREADKGFYGDAAILFWQPQRQGLDFALVDPNNDGIPEGKVKSLKYEMKVGFRTDLGYQFSNGWDVSAGYTYYRTSTQDTAYAPDGGLIYTTFGRPSLVDQANTAVSRAKLDYDVYDLTFGKKLHVEDDVTLRLFGGVRFANINQKQDTLYNGLFADNAAFENKNSFSGAGPILGMEFQGEIYKHFSLFGKISGGMILGNQKASLFGTNNSGLTPDDSFENNYRQNVPVLNLGLGAQWEYHGFSVRLGYEVSNWFNLVNKPQYTGELAEGRYTYTSSDLTVDGFSVQFGIRF